MTAFLGIENTCLKWLDSEVECLIMASNIIVSPKLKSLLDNNKIKPIAVFEELYKLEVKENLFPSRLNTRGDKSPGLRSETRKKSGIYGILNLITGDF